MVDIWFSLRMENGEYAIMNWLYVEFIVDSSTLTEREKDVNIRKLQIVNLRLDNEKLQKEIQKLEVETEVLQVKKNYYKTKLQTIKKEHSEVAAKMEEDNES